MGKARVTVSTIGPIPRPVQARDVGVQSDDHRGQPQWGLAQSSFLRSALDLLLSSNPWSPDGTRLAYTTRVSGVRDLFVINAEGAGGATLFTARLRRSPPRDPIARRRRTCYQ